MFWVLDSVENNIHMKLRLRRNLLGNKHSMATQKSAGKSFRTLSSPSIQKMAKGTPEEPDGSSGAMVINFKGLKKYKNEAAPQTTARANVKGAKDSNEGGGGDPSELVIDLDDDDDIDESLQTGTLAPVCISAYKYVCIYTIGSLIFDAVFCSCMYIYAFILLRSQVVNAYSHFFSCIIIMYFRVAYERFSLFLF